MHGSTHRNLSMKKSPSDFAELYQEALRSQLEIGARLNPVLIEKISSQIRAAGVSKLNLPKLHERYLVVDLLPNYESKKRTALIRTAGKFFAAVIAGSGAEKSGVTDTTRLHKTIKLLSARTVELAASNRNLSHEIIQRKKAETASRKSEMALLKSLQQSDLLKDQLRGLSRQILSVQEEERKKISRELHDVVAQALLGINVRLATLRREMSIHSKDLDGNILRTQKMIMKSANMVHQFARELRPAVLDDLGLIPALQAFMKQFTTRTGLRIHLHVFEGVEKINSAKRTVLYRVAQEALSNVFKHAKASRVDVTISKELNHVKMVVSDDGQSFQIDRIMKTRGNKRLGLLGMRERLEMVGGSFEVDSKEGMGTKIIACIPVNKTTQKRLLKDPI